MSHTRILVHAVWAVKHRKPMMGKAHKEVLCQHIRENAESKNIDIIAVNGWKDHLHCLFFLPPDRNIATVMKLLKGESSHWANQNMEWDEKFGWQEGYFAVSVSPPNLNKLKKYINRQEEHHRKNSFKEEYAAFMKRNQVE